MNSKLKVVAWCTECKWKLWHYAMEICWLMRFTAWPRKKQKKKKRCCEREYNLMNRRLTEWNETEWMKKSNDKNNNRARQVVIYWYRCSGISSSIQLSWIWFLLRAFLSLFQCLHSMDKSSTRRHHSIFCDDDLWWCPLKFIYFNIFSSISVNFWFFLSSFTWFKIAWSTYTHQITRVPMPMISRSIIFM